jgi:PAS domain S-box-containing protein
VNKKPARTSEAKKVPSGKKRDVDLTPVGSTNNNEIPANTGELKARHDLRQVAEERLAERPQIPLDDKGCTPGQIVHELQVHQIELEMQNEALREAQLTLEESRDKYADLYEFAPVGYLILTKNAIIEEANLTCVTILGVDRRKLITRRFRTFISDDDPEAWDRYFTSVLRNTSKQVCELNFKKGGCRVISARLESIRLDRDSAKPVIRIALSDITDRVRAVENLVLKTNDLDELNVAYKTIAAGQENLRQNEAKLLGALEKKKSSSPRSTTG